MESWMIMVLMSCIAGTLASYGTDVYGLETRLDRTIDELEEEVRHLEIQDLARQSRTIDTAYPIGAFSVRMSSNLHGFANHRTLIFKSILLNTQNVYNHHSGVYTCPITGTYVFHFTGSTINGYYPFKANIYKDGSAFAYMYTGYAASTKSQSSAVTGIIHCKKGSHVYVKVDRAISSNCGIQATYTSFSGYLMHGDPISFA